VFSVARSLRLLLLFNVVVVNPPYDFTQLVA